MQGVIRVIWVLLTLCWVAHVVAVFRYPLGNDPAIFQYHAWSLGVGEIPYLDSFDVNTPGIILMHWLWGQFVGFNDAGFLSLVMLVSTGVLFGTARLLKGHFNTHALLVATALGLWAFVGITPWDRGQRELFQGSFMLLSMGALLTNRSLLAGVLAGVAVTLKVTTVLVVIPVALVWLSTHREHAVRAVVGACIPVVVSLVFLAVTGAWDAFFWTQINYLPHHSQQFSVTLADALNQRLVWVLLVVGVAGVIRGGNARIMALIPLINIGLYLFQRHGWTYHLHISIPFILPIVALVCQPLRFKQPAYLISVVSILLAGISTHYDHTKGLGRAHKVDDHWDYDAHVRVAAYLQANGDENDRVLTNNDEQQLLYMARRRSATRCLYSFLCSENHKTEPFVTLSEERLKTVHERPPQWVVWNMTPYAPTLDSLEANPKLKQWISEHCTPRPALGPYGVWRCGDTR